MPFLFIHSFTSRFIIPILSFSRKITVSSNQHYQSKLGKGMIILAWLILLGLLTLLFSNYLDKQHNPNTNPESLFTKQNQKSVILKMNRAGHYLSSGKINGANVIFLLDTGATTVAIPETLARKLQLTKGRTTLSQTANGVVKGHTTMLDTVSLGSITLHNIKGNIIPGMNGGEVLLGMSFLKHLEIIHKGKTLTIKE